MYQHLTVAAVVPAYREQEHIADVITTIRGLGYSLDDPAGPTRG